MPDFKRTHKAQSAMEYLLSYGWAILVIGIIIATLFYTGAFTSSNLSGGICLPTSGFLCSNPVLDSAGGLTITFGELGSTMYITGLGCSNNSSFPSQFYSYTNTINSGQSTSLLFICPISSNTIGSSFSGNLWIQYGQTQTQTIELGSVSAKVSKSGMPGLIGSIQLSPSGGDPAGIALTPNNEYAYVIDYNPGLLNIISTSNDALLSSANPFGHPSYINISKDGYLYAGNSGYGDLYTFNTVSQSISNYLVLPGSIQTISAINTIDYAYFASSNSLYTVNLNTNSLVNTLIINPNGNSNFVGFAASISPSGKYLYLGDRGTGNIVIVNTQTNTIANTIYTGWIPVKTVFSNNGEYAYVGIVNVGVVVINAQTSVPITTISNVNPNQVTQAMVLDNSNGYLYVSNYNPASVSIINTANDMMAGSIVLSNIGSIYLSPDNSYLYALNPSSDTVTIISTLTNKIVTTIPTGTTPSYMAISSDGQRAYVLNAGSNNVTVLGFI